VSQTQTVKFKALDLIKQAEDKLQEAINLLNECKDLEGDNEAQPLCETMIPSIDHDRKLLHRSRLEANELW
jgi:hypothetical protein